MELSSNEKRFGGGGAGFEESSGIVTLNGPEVIVLRG